MAIETGSKLPEATLHTMQDGKPTPVTTNDLFAGKKVAMFAVPAPLRQPAPWLTCPVMLCKQMR